MNKSSNIDSCPKYRDRLFARMTSRPFTCFSISVYIYLKMSGETNLSVLLKTMTPELNEGDYVFCSVPGPVQINPADILCTFREKEGLTIIVSKEIADSLNIPYHFIASWITLTVHSSLQAVGLTAAFSNALATAGISCNVVAAFYHDHIFVAKEDAQKAMGILRKFSVSFN